jgi:hypothetical protein
MRANRTFRALLGVAMLPAVAMAADAPFKFDRLLAKDLAGAYVRAAQRARPDRALPGISYVQPDLVARVAKGPRRLVFVSFRSSKPGSGAGVVLELCSATSELVLVDVSWTDGLDHYLTEIRGIDESSYLALPKVCPDGVP